MGIKGEMSGTVYVTCTPTTYTYTPSPNAIHKIQQMPTECLTACEILSLIKTNQDNLYNFFFTINNQYNNNMYRLKR